MSFPDRCYARLPLDEEAPTTKKSLVVRMMSMFKSFGYDFTGTPDGWKIRLLDGTDLLVAHDKLDDWMVKTAASAISKHIHRSSRDSGTAIDGIADPSGLFIVHENVRGACG